MNFRLHAGRQLVPLLAAPQEAERIARDIAAAQANIAPVAALQRALKRQSRQETVHAAVFASALACLPGRAACPPRLAAALATFRHRLEADVAAGRLTASLFGLQHVLEALGHVALQPPGGELASLGDHFVPLRGVLANQELGHRRLGEVWMPRLALPHGTEQRRALRDAESGLPRTGARGRGCGAGRVRRLCRRAAALRAGDAALPGRAAAPARGGAV